MFDIERDMSCCPSVKAGEGAEFMQIGSTCPRRSETPEAPCADETSLSFSGGEVLGAKEGLVGVDAILCSVPEYEYGVWRYGVLHTLYLSDPRSEVPGMELSMCVKWINRHVRMWMIHQDEPQGQDRARTGPGPASNRGDKVETRRVSRR